MGKKILCEIFFNTLVNFKKFSIQKIKQRRINAHAAVAYQRNLQIITVTKRKREGKKRRSFFLPIKARLTLAQKRKKGKKMASETPTRMPLVLMAVFVACFLAFSQGCDLNYQDCAAGTGICKTNAICGNQTCTISGSICIATAYAQGICYKPGVNTGQCIAAGCGCGVTAQQGQIPFDPVPSFGDPYLNNILCRFSCNNLVSNAPGGCPEATGSLVYQGPGTLGTYGSGRHICTYFYNNTYLSYACLNTNALCMDAWLNDPETPEYRPYPSCVYLPGDYNNVVTRCSNYSARVCDPRTQTGCPSGLTCSSDGMKCLCDTRFQAQCSQGYYCGNDNVCHLEPTCSVASDCPVVTGAAYTCFMGKCTHTSCGNSTLNGAFGVSGSSRDEGLCYESRCVPDLDDVQIVPVPSNPGPGVCVYHMAAGSLAYQCVDPLGVCIPWYTDSDIYPGCRYYTGNFSLTTWCGYQPEPECLPFPPFGNLAYACLAGGTCVNFHCVYPTVSPSSTTSPSYVPSSTPTHTPSASPAGLVCNGLLCKAQNPCLDYICFNGCYAVNTKLEGTPCVIYSTGENGRCVDFGTSSYCTPLQISMSPSPDFSVSPTPAFGFLDGCTLADAGKPCRLNPASCWSVGTCIIESGIPKCNSIPLPDGTVCQPNYSCNEFTGLSTNPCLTSTCTAGLCVVRVPEPQLLGIADDGFPVYKACHVSGVMETVRTCGPRSSISVSSYRTCRTQDFISFDGTLSNATITSAQEGFSPIYYKTTYDAYLIPWPITINITDIIQPGCLEPDTECAVQTCDQARSPMCAADPINEGGSCTPTGGSPNSGTCTSGLCVGPSPSPSPSPFEYPCSYYNGTLKPEGTDCGSCPNGVCIDGGRNQGACKCFVSAISQCDSLILLSTTTIYQLYYDDGTGRQTGGGAGTVCALDACIGYCTNGACSPENRPDGTECAFGAGTCYGGVCIPPSTTPSASASVTASESPSTSQSASSTPVPSPVCNPLVQGTCGVGYYCGADNQCHQELTCLGSVGGGSTCIAVNNTTRGCLGSTCTHTSCGLTSAFVGISTGAIGSVDTALCSAACQPPLGVYQLPSVPVTPLQSECAYNFMLNPVAFACQDPSATCVRRFNSSGVFPACYYYNGASSGRDCGFSPSVPQCVSNTIYPCPSGYTCTPSYICMQLSSTPTQSPSLSPSSSATRTPTRTPSASPVYECSFGLGNPKPAGTPCSISACYAIPCSSSTCNGNGVCQCTTMLPQCIDNATFVVTTFQCSRTDGGGFTSAPINYNYTSCDDGEACTLDTCTESLGGCVHTPVSSGEPCGTPESGWICMSGVCTAPTPSPTPSSLLSATASASPSQTLTASASASDSSTSSPSASPTSAASGTPSASPTSAASGTPSATPSSAASGTPSPSPIPVLYTQCGVFPDGTPCYTNNPCLSNGYCSVGLCVSTPENPGYSCVSGVPEGPCVTGGTCNGVGRCVPDVTPSSGGNACNELTGSLDHFRLCDSDETFGAVVTELTQTWVDMNGQTQSIVYATEITLNNVTLVSDVQYLLADSFSVSANCNPTTVCMEVVCQLYPEPTCTETPRNQGQLCPKGSPSAGSGVCAPDGTCGRCMYAYTETNFQRCPSGSICGAENKLCYNTTTNLCISDSQCIAGHGWYAQCIGGSCQYESCQDYSGGSSFTSSPPFQSTSQALCSFDCLHDIYPTQLSYVPVLPAIHQCVYTTITGTVAYECPSTILTCVPQFTLSGLAPVCVETSPQISVASCSFPYQCSNTLGIECPPTQFCDSLGVCVQPSSTPSPSMYVAPSASPSTSPTPVHYSQCNTVPNGTPCYTGNPCLYGGVCSSGLCVSSTVDPGTPCTTGLPYNQCITGSECDWTGRCAPSVLPTFQYTACNNATGALDYFKICFESELYAASISQLTQTYVDMNGVELSTTYAITISLNGVTLVTEDVNSDATYYYDSPTCAIGSSTCSNVTCVYNPNPTCVITPTGFGELCDTPAATLNSNGVCSQDGTCGNCRFYLESRPLCPDGTLCGGETKYCVNATQTCTTSSQCTDLLGWQHGACINGTCQYVSCSGSNPQQGTLLYPEPYYNAGQLACALQCVNGVFPSALVPAPSSPQPHQCVYTTGSGVVAYQCPATDFVCVPQFDLTQLKPVCTRFSPYATVSSCSTPYQCSIALGIPCPNSQVCTALGTCIAPSTTPSSTASVSRTPSTTPSASASQTPSTTNTASSTQTPSTTNTASASATQTASTTNTASSTQTPSATNTASATQTPSNTNTASATQTPSTTNTASSSGTPSASATPSPTSTASASKTASSSFSPSPTPFHCFGQWCCNTDMDCEVEEDSCVVSKCITNQCYSTVKDCDDHNAETYDLCMHGQCFHVDNDVRGYCKYCKGMGKICSASTSRPEIDDDDAWPYNTDDHDWPDLDSCDECKKFTTAHLCAAAYSSSVLMPYCGSLPGSGYMVYFPTSPYAVSYNNATPPVSPWLFGPLDHDDTKFVRYGYKHAKLSGVVSGLNATTGPWAWKINVRMTKVSSLTYTPSIRCHDTGVNASLTDLYSFHDSTLVGVGTTNYGDRIKIRLSIPAAQVGPWANNMNGNIGIYFGFSWQTKKRNASYYGPWLYGGVVTADVNPECKSPCKKPCYHGLCDQDNGDCLCDDDWRGEDCNTPRTCLHGTYVPFVNACICSTGWTGKYCDIAYMKRK